MERSSTLGIFNYHIPISSKNYKKHDRLPFWVNFAGFILIYTLYVISKNQKRRSCVKSILDIKIDLSKC